MQVIQSDYDGYRKLTFTVGGRESLIICPKDALPGNPWVWRAEFFGAFDMADRALLAKGWHLAYHCVSNMYGCPQAIEWMHAFYLAAVTAFDLSKKAALFGFSRGGLYAFHYACAYPDEVSLLYLDAPVLDIRSWPGGKGASKSPSEALWAECLGWYGLDEQTAETFSGNPVDRASFLAKTGIPILLVAGLSDDVVPYAENGALLYARYRAAGGVVDAIEKPGCGHHPHSLEDPSPIVAWVLKHGMQRIDAPLENNFNET